jgi:hypothetical protein
MFSPYIQEEFKIFKYSSGEGRRIWAERVKELNNYYRVKEERNIIHTIKRSKSN